MHTATTESGFIRLATSDTKNIVRLFGVGLARFTLPSGVADWAECIPYGRDGITTYTFPSTRLYFLFSY